MTIGEEKKAIRVEAKKRRGLIDREKKDKEIAKRVLSLKEYEEAEQIFIYVSFRDEVDTRLIIEQAWRAGKQVACPLVMGEDMEFFEVLGWDDFSPGIMGILEPQKNNKIEIEEKKMRLMLMPGLAFDWERRRIGYGGGFYDRYLKTRNRQFVTAALAYTEQIFERVPSIEQDIRPSMIITEEGIIYGSEDNGTACKKSSGWSKCDGKYRKK